MGNYISPGVYTKEKDLSTIVPNVATTVAALVGYSTRGALIPTLVTNSQQFISEYGEPVAGRYFHYTALAFLEKGNALYCRRVVNGALYAGVDIKDADSDASEVNDGFTTGQSTAAFYYDSSESNVLFNIFAKDPGVWGSNIKIIIKDINNLYYDEDTDYACEVADQYTFVIEVYYPDSDGDYSLVESWKVSRVTKTNGYGKQLYLEDVINDYSAYILVADNTDIASTSIPKANAEIDGVDYVQCASGSDGNAATSSQIVAAWGDFENTEDIDIRIMLAGGYTSVSVCNEMIRIAEARKDCIAILDVPYASVITPAITVAWRRDTLNANSSYAGLYAPWVTINDSYNDKVIEVPPSGYVGAQFAYNDYVADTWFAPAGFNRGILNVLGITDVYTEGERDTLYKYQVNPLQTFRGQGNIIYGQKTLQVKPSALDRINVRRLLIIIEKSVAIAMQSFLFEPNNELTRFKVEAILIDYMDLLSAKGAFQTEAGDDGYAIVCNTVNNPPAVIDRNELYVDIFVKPTRAAEFIQVQAIITASGASFAELVSRGAMF